MSTPGQPPSPPPPEAALGLARAVQAIPAVPVALSEAAGATDGAGAPQGKRILLVDDSPATIRILTSMLQGIGELRSATTSADALTIAESWHPDLVVCDIHIDELTGIDICRRLKSRDTTEDIDFILISSSRDLDSEISALTAGASDFIEKPLKAARVRSRVLNQLRAHARIAAVTRRAAASFSTELVGFISCSLDGVLLDIAPPVLRLLDTGTVALGRTALWDLFGESDRDELRRRVAAAATGGRLESLRVTLRCSGNRQVDTRIYGWLSTSEQGRVLLVALEDERERLRAERQRISRSVEAVLAELCGGIAHQLNNMLQVSMGHLDLARDEPLPSGARLHLDQVQEGLEQSAEVTVRLRDYALSRGGYQPAVVVLEQELRVLQGTLAEHGAAHGARLDLDTQDPGLQVTIDRRALRYVLEELVDRAAVTAGSGGVVTLRCRPAASASPGESLARLEISASATAGARAQHAPTPKSRRRAAEGWDMPGLGLVFIRQDVELMSGTLHLQERGGRMTATIDLPAHGSPPETTAPARKTAPG